jgi:outer membrane protein TolC
VNKNALYSIFVCLVSLVAGCAKYRAQPLTTEAVDRELAVPDEQALRVAAGDLHHPILKPMALGSTGLSPDEAAVVAVIVNPDLRTERARRAIATAQVLQAGLLPNPQISGGLAFPVNAGPADSFTAYNGGLNWEVTSLIARNERRQSAAAAAASVYLDVAWKEWQVAEGAKTAAYDVLALEAQLELVREIERQFSENRDVVRRAVEQHARTLVDLSAAEAAAQDARLVVLAGEKDLRHQRLLLNRALGLPPEAPVVLRPEPLPSVLRPPAPDELLAGLERRRLDLMALKRGYDSQDATLRAAILGQFPKINLGFNGGRDTANVKTIGIGVTIDIPIFDHNQGVIAAETATRQRLFDEYVGRVFVARSDIATAIDDIRGVNVQIAAAEQAIPNLERLVQTYGRAVEQGNADVLSFYAIRSTLAQRRVDVLKLKQQLIQNWVALEIASGQYLPRHDAGVSPTTGPTTREVSP